MTKRRWLLFFTFVVLVLMVKEDVALMTFVLGLYVARKYDMRVGLLTSAFSLLWFASAVWVVLPAFNGEGTLDAWRVPYGGIGGLLKRTITHPWDVIALALGPDKRWYLWQLFVSFGLLSLLAPSAVVLAIGPLASNLLSTFWYQYHLQYHYTTLIVPVLAFAAVLGLARVRRQQARAAGVGILIAAAVLTGWLWGPSQLARHPQYLGDSERGACRADQGRAPTYPAHRQRRRAVQLRHPPRSPPPHLRVSEPLVRAQLGQRPQYRGGTARRRPGSVHRRAARRNGSTRAAAPQPLGHARVQAGGRRGGAVVLKRVAPAQPLDPALQQQLRDLAYYS